jgi:hypothetical protein
MKNRYEGGGHVRNNAASRLLLPTREVDDSHRLMTRGKNYSRKSVGQAFSAYALAREPVSRRFIRPPGGLHSLIFPPSVTLSAKILANV